MNLSRRLLLPAVLLLLFAGPISSEATAGQKKLKAESTDGPDTLAFVNGGPITSGEFLSRFEMSLYPGKDDPTMLEKTKREFLYSMIAEKLLSRAAAESEEPYTPSEVLLKNEMEEIFMRDALFRKEIVPRGTVAEKEIRRGFEISIYSYLVDAFYFDADTLAARGFYDAVRAKKESLLYMIADSLNIRHDTLDIPYGESSGEIEDAFFGHRKGFISRPTATVDGVIVFRVLQRGLNSRFTSGTTADRMYRIKQILVNRKQTELGNEYVESVMKGIEVRVNYAIFRPLVYAIREVFRGQRPASYDPYYRLSPADLVALGSRFYSQLNEPLLSFKGGSISLGEIFQQIPTAMFASEDTTLPEITFALHGSLRFISQNHFLVQRARELGLQNSWEVRHNVAMVVDAFRSYRMANAVTDTVTVTQRQADEFFSTHHDEVLNSIRLRLRTAEAGNIDEAIDAYTRLSGEKELTVDPNDTSARWVNAYNLGETGAVLSQLKIGDVYGPLEVNGKFYIYQLLDKRSSANGAAIRNSIEIAGQMLLAKEKSETLSRYIAGLAEKENVRIFRDNVLTLKVTPLQMLTYRLVGFGGRVLAVPALYPRERWIDYFHEEKRPPQP